MEKRRHHSNGGHADAAHEQNNILPQSKTSTNRRQRIAVPTIISGEIEAVGKHMEDSTHFAQLVRKNIYRTFRQLPNFCDSQCVELFGGCQTYIKQVAYRQWIDDLLIVIFFDPGDGIRLFIIAPQLCGDLVV